jgi:hypothetical protein
MQNFKEFMEALLDNQELKSVFSRIRLSTSGDVESNLGDGWYPSISTSSLLIVPSDWEIAPKTININGIEVPEPERTPLKYHTRYFKTEIDTRYNIPEYLWENDTADRESLSNGYIHLTREAAEIHREALRSFTKSS